MQVGAIVLVENSGHVVEKDALMKAVWPDTFVGEDSLTRNISLLRRTLGNNPAAAPYIETLPRRGYRFRA
jgi:DNA-binding winged helix-turn-helix (wHTH) protein